LVKFGWGSYLTMNHHKFEKKKGVYTKGSDLRPRKTTQTGKSEKKWLKIRRPQLG